MFTRSSEKPALAKALQARQLLESSSTYKRVSSSLSLSASSATLVLKLSFLLSFKNQLVRYRESWHSETVLFAFFCTRKKAKLAALDEEEAKKTLPTRFKRGRNTFASLLLAPFVVIFPLARSAINIKIVPVPPFFLLLLFFPRILISSKKATFHTRTPFQDNKKTTTTTFFWKEEESQELELRESRLLLQTRKLALLKRFPRSHALPGNEDKCLKRPFYECEMLRFFIIILRPLVSLTRLKNL